MSNNTFDGFWKLVIEPSINFCEEEIDSTDRVLIELDSTDCKKYKKELNEIYVRKREWLKSKYLPKKNKEEAYLDFHKLGSILCRSIIGNKYFSFSTTKAHELYDAINRSDEKNEIKLRREIDSIYINYKLAFYVLSGIAYIDLLYKISKKSKTLTDKDEIKLVNIIYKKLNNNFELFPYRKSNNHDDFESSVIIALMKSDSLMRDFDYLAYSTILFQWQEYTKNEIYIEILLEYKELGFDHIPLEELKKAKEIIG